MTNHVHNI